MVTVTETKEAGSQGRGGETAWRSASSTGEGLCHPTPTCTPTSAPITQPPAGGPYHFLSGEGPRFFLFSPNTVHFLLGTGALTPTGMVHALKELMLQWRRQSVK